MMMLVVVCVNINNNNNNRSNWWWECRRAVVAPNVASLLINSSHEATLMLREHFSCMESNIEHKVKIEMLTDVCLSAHWQLGSVFSLYYPLFSLFVSEPLRDVSHEMHVYPHALLTFIIHLLSLNHKHIGMRNHSYLIARALFEEQKPKVDSKKRCFIAGLFSSMILMLIRISAN